MVNTYETIFSGSDLPTENLGEVIAWLKGQYLKIPLKYRDKAILEISAEMDFSFPCTEIEIRYLRPKTEEELEEDRRGEEAMKTIQEAGERRILEQLKKKYEST